MINLATDYIKVEGHANFAKIGTDIYCAGISAICLGALNWFSEEDINYEIDNGYLFIKLIKLSESNLMKLNLLKIQLKALNHGEYKKYISLKEI